jgi:hypothetical protein
MDIIIKIVRVVINIYTKAKAQNQFGLSNKFGCLVLNQRNQQLRDIPHQWATSRLCNTVLQKRKYHEVFPPGGVTSKLLELSLG